MRGMAANSVDIRCPARKGAEGQYRTKQMDNSPSGVRNEQVLPPEGKVCSGLHGDMQRMTEMIIPALKKVSNKSDGEAHWLGREYDPVECLPPRNPHFLIDGDSIIHYPLAAKNCHRGFIS